MKRRQIEAPVVFTVAALLKGNLSFFSKQLGINCTCEQIGLFLISTSGCCSQSWKFLKKSDLFTRTINPYLFLKQLDFLYKMCLGGLLFFTRAVSAMCFLLNNLCIRFRALCISCIQTLTQGQIL